MYDVCIIGAGVIGANIARLLSQYQLRICLIEKAADVSCGCSKANSGIVHGGYSDKPGTLAAELCVKGNRLYAQLEAELHFGYRETGSYVIALEEEDIPRLKALEASGLTNGVNGLALLSGEEVLQREPHLNPAIKGALYCAEAGVTSPYEFVIALVENAIANGVELRLNSLVTALARQQDGFEITINETEKLRARYVINAAGAGSDAISALLGITGFKIHPRRGQYVLLNKNQNHLVSSVIFQVPSKLGKGILVTPTYHGNIMVGPNAEEIDDKDDVSTDEATLAFIAATARKSLPTLDFKQSLTSFAGNRPVCNDGGWTIEATEIPGYIHLIGIDSPGLTASPAIALKVRGILASIGLVLKENPAFNPYREAIIHKKPADFAGKIDGDSPELNIICRCETITEAEIIDSLHRGIPVTAVDAVKRRTRAGMGQCQGAFCRPRVKALLARELGIPLENVPENLSSTPPEVRAKRLALLKL
ncbi:MAG: NAD(P)/FAD-dependent oxidoreductase [Sporomusaceae bacterium]|nr:NAD(P)/FAD-dependent oxidoreductase [Sporomusaceae bacterium]